MRMSAVLALNDGKCHLCEKHIFETRPSWASDRWWSKWGPSRDHIIPRAQASGLHGNLMPAHRWCNIKRDQMPIEQYKARLKRRAA